MGTKGVGKGTGAATKAVRGAVTMATMAVATVATPLDKSAGPYCRANPATLCGMRVPGACVLAHGRMRADERGLCVAVREACVVDMFAREWVDGCVLAFLFAAEWRFGCNQASSLLPAAALLAGMHDPRPAKGPCLPSISTPRSVIPPHR